MFFSVRLFLSCGSWVKEVPKISEISLLGFPPFIQILSRFRLSSTRTFIIRVRLRDNSVNCCVFRDLFVLEKMGETKHSFKMLLFASL